MKERYGGGGFLIYAPQGQLVAAAALYYGPEGPTNNTAEARAMVNCMRACDQLDWS